MKSLLRAAAFLFFVLAAFYLRACLSVCGWSAPTGPSLIDGAWRAAQHVLQGADGWLAASHREWWASVVFTGAYALAVAVADRYPPRTVVPLAVAAGFGALILLFTRTYYSTDMYDYLVRGRLLVIHHANPFIVPPKAFPDDLYFPLANWPRTVWVYGPVWLLVVSALAAVPASILGGVLMLRGLMITAHMFNGWLLWSLLAEAPAGRRARQTALYLFCPLALSESAINAHCDLLMVTFLLAGTLAARCDRARLAAIYFALAALVKAYAGPALVFFGLAQVARARPGLRLRTGLGLAAPAAALAIVAYAPFVHTMSAFLAPIRGAAAQGLVQSWASVRVVRSWLKPNHAVILAHTAMLGAFLYGVVISARKLKWQEATGWFFVIFCSATTWFQPWYAVMALAMAMTAESPSLAAAAVTLAVLAPICYLGGCMNWSAVTEDRLFLFTQFLPLDVAAFVWMLRRPAAPAR